MSLSFTAMFVLRAIAQGRAFGFEIMDATALPSGTVYPALRRLEAARLVSSHWESDAEARRESRPRRRYYELTRSGRQELAGAAGRFDAVSRLLPGRLRI